MKVLLFGATGMIGQGVLRECLLDPGVDLVVTVGRAATAVQHAKLRQIVHRDLWHYETMESDLAGFDACFFCLGVSSTGLSAEEYERVTYGITVAAAEVLARLNARMTFVYVSGAGADSSEQGRIGWARVKGRTENTLLGMPFAAAYMFRPGIIQPLHGATSKTGVYRFFYALLGPLLPLLRRAFPDSVLTTEEIGRAMLAAVRRGYEKRVLESRDIRALARA
jgi:uncharacterized protein YbjT (DUF2867 family)